MRICCPRCGYVDDEDEFCEHDEVEDAIEDGRDDARAIQATLMGGRDALAASLLMAAGRIAPDVDFLDVVKAHGIATQFDSASPAGGVAGG